MGWRAESSGVRAITLGRCDEVTRWTLGADQVPTAKLSGKPQGEDEQVLGRIIHAQKLSDRWQVSML
ncbi:hypothetical protein NPIL_535951 [Nephila pilipes]|uniref:Uncharacterized protein n=1 Tax=Nephila pilipes TaxID=299642 RepID=A0A8X6NK90_NEPPI|nr:hypothetical protein NPIL_535951 [Nephila pilipes]